MFIGQRFLLISRAKAFTLFGALSLSVLAISPASGEIKDDAKQLNNEGVLALKHNDYQLAIDKFCRALELLSTYRIAKDNLAVAYNNFGLRIKNNPSDAIQYFHKAVFLDADNLTSQANLTGVIQRMGKSPDDIETRIALGDSSKLSGDNIGAIVEYCEALKLKSESVVRDKLSQTLKDFEKSAKPTELAIYKDSLQRAHGFAATSNSVASAGSNANKVNLGNNVSATNSKDSSASNKVQSSVPAGPLTTYCDAVRQKILADYMDRITWTGYVMVDADVDKDGKITSATVNMRSEGSADDKASAVQFVKSINCVGVPPASLGRNLRLSFVLGKNPRALMVSVGDIYFGDYMAELQKKIKSNWYPPKEDSTLKAKVLFRLYRDGNFEGLKVLQSTGNTVADASALAAVMASSPFAALPDGSARYVDVEFDFDYNVFKKGKQLTSQNTSSTNTNSSAVGSNGNSSAAVASTMAGANGKFNIKNIEAANAISGADQCFAQGMAALGQRDYALAIQFMESAIALDPQNVSAKKTLSIAYTAYARTFLGSKPDLAMENFRKAKERWPENPMVPATIEQAESMFGAGSQSKPREDVVRL